MKEWCLRHYVLTFVLVLIAIGEFKEIVAVAFTMIGRHVFHIDISP